MSLLPHARPLVLVVEDEPLLRFHAVDLIEAAGFDTLEAGTADDAIAMLVKRLDIRIVFTDIDMPGSMNGIKLAAAVRHRWPPIDIILTSGYQTVAAGDIPSRGFFLTKPYNDNDLLVALRSLVA